MNKLKKLIAIGLLAAVASLGAPTVLAEGPTETPAFTSSGPTETPAYTEAAEGPTETPAITIFIINLLVTAIS